MFKRRQKLHQKWNYVKENIQSHVETLKKPRFYVSILKCMAFYVCQYLVIIGLGVLMFIMANFFALLRDLPRLTGHESVLNLQPGLSVLPRPDSLTSLIRYRIGHRQSYGVYVHDLMAFEQFYERHSQGSRLMDCSKHVGYQDNHKYSCKFPIDQGTIGCNIGNFYGYDEEEPCIIIKLNRIIGWIPQFNEKSPNETYAHGFPGIQIKCEGVNDIDKINVGTICYFDEESASRKSEDLMPFTDGGCSKEFGVVRNYYFPYKKQRSYQNPFIWVKFFGISRNVLIMIRCWAISDNIEVNFEEGKGSVQFEFLVD